MRFCRVFHGILEGYGRVLYGFLRVLRAEGISFKSLSPKPHETEDRSTKWPPIIGVDTGRLMGLRNCGYKQGNHT